MSDYQPALSPSRAKEYLQCPLKFRFSVVDRIMQPPTVATIRGTLVHAVLEALFDTEPAGRTEQYARNLVGVKWEELNAKNSEYLPVVEAEMVVSELLAQSEDLLSNYFHLEIPSRINPAGKEVYVQTRLPSGILLRGIVDRVDRAPDGRLRVIDYKTGKAPSTRFLDDALFQMRFYALVLREIDRLPSRMQLLYLKSQSVLTLDPQAADVDQFEDRLLTLWDAVSKSALSGDFVPKKGPLCGWCSYQAICPLFGGEPGLPAEEDIERLLLIRQVPT